MKDATPVKLLVDLIVDRYHKIESSLPLLVRELNPVERKALRLVASAGKMTVGHVGEALAMPPSTTTWMVGNLVKKGVFRREHDPADKRKIWISLGEKGEALAGLMDRIPDRIAADLLYKLDKDQRDAFVDLVEAALARIEEIGAFK
jgi:DNA-binding MarR family transcriptional regulator